MDNQAKLFEKKKEILYRFLSDLVGHSHLHPYQTKSVKNLVEKYHSFTYEAFSKTIPILKKSDIFGDLSYIQPIVNQQLQKGMKLIPAAGTTGELLSFRFHNPNAEAAQFQLLAPLVEKVFQTQLGNCIFINAYPSGIHLPDSLHSVDCGAKPEVLKLTLKLLQGQSHKHIVICQPAFLKYCVVHGFITQTDFLKSYFLIGGTWCPKSYESFLGHYLKLNPKEVTSRVASMFGIAEIGLGIGIQTPQLSLLRPQETQTEASPMLYDLDTNRFFLESIQGNLVITLLNSHGPFPLLRYQTGDRGEIFHGDGLSKLSLELPSEKVVFSVQGRIQDSEKTYPILHEKLEELILQTPELFDYLSGNYQINFDSILFEIFRKPSSEATLSQKIQKLLNVQCEIRLVECLITKNQIRIDLLRKPRVYGS